MNVSEAILTRRSVRSYKDKEIPDEKLQRVMESARMAPSARNKQDWKFVIVKDEEKRSELREAAGGQKFVEEAPAVIAGVTTDPENEMKCDMPSGIIDVTIAMDHITLKAAEEGLGTCWIGAFDQEETKKILNVPEGCDIVALMPIGFPEEELEAIYKDRKNPEDITCEDTYY
ncbi:MAG: nitroreductase family protein [Candidatus Aenigmatarchaeota archaeon]